MSPAAVRAIANFISVVLAPLAKVAWAFIKMKFKIGKNNTKIELELEELEKALEEYDDKNTPQTEEQKQKVIAAARKLLRGE